MLQRLIRSTGAVAVLVLFVFAAVIGTAGLSDASVTRGAVILSATSPAPMELTACDQNTCQAIANSGTTTVTDGHEHDGAEFGLHLRRVFRERYDHRRECDDVSVGGTTR